MIINQRDDEKIRISEEVLKKLGQNQTGHAFAPCEVAPGKRTNLWAEDGMKFLGPVRIIAVIEVCHPDEMAQVFGGAVYKNVKDEDLCGKGEKGKKFKFIAFKKER